jgi:hypothetical protein
VRKIAAVIILVLSGLCFAEKNFTAGFLYGFGNNINIHMSNSNFGGMSGLTLKADGDLNTDSGIGIFAEATIPQTALPKKFDVAAGFSLIKKAVFKAKMTEKTLYQGLSGSAIVEFENINGKIAMNSLYVKPRYFLTDRTNKKDIAIYVAGKLSYNFMAVGGDDFDLFIDVENCFGFGASVGAIIDDTFDIALSFDRLAGKASWDVGIYDDAGSLLVSDTLEGTYDMLNFTLSAGYRF